MELEVLKAFVIAAIQGLTEFLPVSSSGHMVIAKHLLGLEEVGITIEIVTHLATSLAVVIFLRRQILGLISSFFNYLRHKTDSKTQRDVTLIAKLVVASIPAAVLGLSLRSRVEGFFSDPKLSATMLILTGIYLVFCGFARKRERPLGYREAFVIGLAQAVAIIPGISRSGLTVGAALLLGIGAREAFEFSLLLSLPAILGAGLVELISRNISASPGILFVGFLTAFGLGYVAIELLLGSIVKHRFHAFGYYLIPLGIVLLVAL